MGIGPFTSYVPPGVYTNTIVAADGASGAAGARIPVIIGVGSETYTKLNLEMVRGSSASVDTLSNKEDMSGRFVNELNKLVDNDGTLNRIRVRNFPIVDGAGKGVTSNSISSVQVLINDEPAGVAKVVGETGDIWLSQLPLSTDTVTVTYYYHRGDTQRIDEDLSNQVNGTRKDFYVLYPRIVDGTGGGVTTTDISKVTVKVDGVAVVVSSVDGTNGVITLAAAPADGKTVLVTYWTNTYQDTFDPLPNKGVSSMISMGKFPGKMDYAEGYDYVNEGDRINWGHSYLVKFGDHTPKAEYFDDTQVLSTLIDNHMHKELATAVLASVNDATTMTWKVSYTPTDGSGLGRPTKDYSKVSVWVDGNLSKVSYVDHANKNIILSAAVAKTAVVEVTYWYNMLVDETYTVKCTVAGASGTGKYKLSSLTSGKPAHAIVSPKTSSGGETSIADTDYAEAKLWPGGVSDLQTVMGYSITEKVTLTFTSSTEFTVSSNVNTGSGSVTTNNANKGKVGRTYVDPKTGVRFTVWPDADANLTFAADDKIVFVVTSEYEYTTDPGAVLDISGIKLYVLNTKDVGVDDTAIVKTYNKSGLEPSIGEFYYTSYKWDKTDYSAKVWTKEKAIEAEYGTISIDNKVSLAAHLAFLNGAQAVAIKQIKREFGKSDANSTAYINAITELEKKIQNLYNADIIVPLTTAGDVQAYLKTHCERMSSERYQAERVAVLGFPIGTTPVKAQQLAPGLSTSRMTLLYPEGVILGIVDEMGVENEYLVDGSMLAAAMAGKLVSPQYDVATDMTRKELVGFKRLSRVLDAVEANQVAIAGITVLEDLKPTIRVRQWFTSDMSNVLTRTPYVTLIIDKVQQDSRASLESFIGKKNLPSLIGDMESSLKGTLEFLKSSSILSDYSGVEVHVDPLDPTIIQAVAKYKPVFSVSWIRLTLSVRA